MIRKFFGYGTIFLAFVTDLIDIFSCFKIQDLEATIHKKDMELNDLNAR